MTKCKVSFEVDKEVAKTVIALVLDLVDNLRMEDIDGSNVVPYRRKRGDNWCEKYRAPIIDYFRQQGGTLKHDDHGLLAVLERMGLKPTSVSPLLSDMTRSGVVQRIGRGHYRLAG